MIFDSNGNDFVVWSSLEFAKKIRISPECSSKWSQYFSITYHVPVFFSLSPRNRGVKNSVFSGWIYFEFLYLGHTFIALNNIQFSWQSLWASSRISNVHDFNYLFNSNAYFLHMMSSSWICEENYHQSMQTEIIWVVIIISCPYLYFFAKRKWNGIVIAEIFEIFYRFNCVTFWFLGNN